MIVKALSLWNPPFLPWATLCVTGDKRNETRSRRMYHRGPLLIHATAVCPLKPDDWAREGHVIHHEAQETICRAQEAARMTWGEHTTQGCILGIVELTGCEEVTLLTELPAEPERSFGNYAYGRFVLTLSHPRMLKTPIPARGAQGVWSFETSGERELEHLLAEKGKGCHER